MATCDNCGKRTVRVRELDGIRVVDEPGTPSRPGVWCVPCAAAHARWRTRMDRELAKARPARPHRRRIAPENQVVGLDVAVHVLVDYGVQPSPSVADVLHPCGA